MKMTTFPTFTKNMFRLPDDSLKTEFCCLISVAAFPIVYEYVVIEV